MESGGRHRMQHMAETEGATASVQERWRFSTSIAAGVSFGGTIEGRSFMMGRMYLIGGVALFFSLALGGSSAWGQQPEL